MKFLNLIIFFIVLVSTSAWSTELISPHCKEPFNPQKRGYFKKTGNLKPETLYQMDEIDSKDWSKSRI